MKIKMPSSINGKMPSLNTKKGQSDGTTNSEHLQSTSKIFPAGRILKNREETRGRETRKGIYKLVSVRFDAVLPARGGGIAAGNLHRPGLLPRKAAPSGREHASRQVDAVVRQRASHPDLDSTHHPATHQVDEAPVEIGLVSVPDGRRLELEPLCLPRFAGVACRSLRLERRSAADHPAQTCDSRYWTADLTRRGTSTRKTTSDDRKLSSRTAAQDGSALFWTAVSSPRERI